MDVNATNPYESPSAEAYESPSAGERRTKVKTPHGTSIRKEAWRGAKFGAKVMAIGMGVLTGITWLFMFGVVVVGWLSTGVSPLAQLGGAVELMKVVSASVFVVALTSFYAAIAGAFVMATAAFFRKFRGTVLDQTVMNTILESGTIPEPTAPGEDGEMVAARQPLQRKAAWP
jgi:hypothetical protein